MLSGVGKVRFARTEIDHVYAFAAQTVRVGGNLHSGRNADGRDSFGDLRSGLHQYLNLLLNRKVFSHAGCEHVGGTNCATSPPRVMISLIMRELMNEILLAGHEEECFGFGAHAAIQKSHLQFHFVVGDGANAAEDNICGAAGGVFDQQAVEGVDSLRSAVRRLLRGCISSRSSMVNSGCFVVLFRTATMS